MGQHRPMNQPSLPNLLDHLHEQVEAALRTARLALHHPTDKGDASEQVWIDLLSSYLPKRYVVSKAHVVDSEGNFSQQIDVVIHDRQYSPPVVRRRPYRSPKCYLLSINGDTPTAGSSRNPRAHLLRRPRKERRAPQQAPLQPRLRSSSWSPP